METPDERHLLDYILVLIKWRRLLIVGTVLATVVAAGVTFMLPERWTARTSLLPPEEEGPGLGLSLLSGNGLPASLAGLVGMSTPSERLLTLLDSRRLQGLAVDRHGLVEHYGALHRDHAIDLFAETVDAELGGDGSLAIEVTASTPKLAAELANTVAELLDNLNRGYRRRQAQATRLFLEDRVASTKVDLASDAGQLRTFQNAHGIVDIEAQTMAAVDVVKGIVLELSLLQVELGVVTRQLSADHSESQLLALKVGELERQLRTLVGDLSHDIGRDAARGFRDRPLGPPLGELPDLMHDFAELSLQLKVREEILAFLSAKLEEAKYREALNMPTLQVLDPATPPKTRSAPRRVILTLAAGGGALVLLALLAFVLEAWQRGGATYDERLQAIRGELRR